MNMITKKKGIQMYACWKILEKTLWKILQIWNVDVAVIGLATSSALCENELKTFATITTTN